MYEISLCLAGIRPHFWKRLYDSALISCTRYPFELVIISPFALPDELKGINNIKHIEEWGCPTRASQIGALNCSGKLLYYPCDDGVFLPNALDQAIDLYNATCQPKDGIVMRYCEGAGMNAAEFPLEYWNARYHINIAAIGSDWKIAPQPMLGLEYFKEIGGIDCENYECMAFATHDLCYRLQRDGGRFYLSPLEIMNCDNYGEHGVDHSPIYKSQVYHDQPIFFQKYSDPNIVNHIKIDINTWQSKSAKWAERWN